jgi:hypothetical protein
MPENIATHVNVWKYKSVNNDTEKFSFICEYFFNNGHLDANEIEKQFNRVVLNLEMNDFRVHGMCCDAGGANARFYRMQRKAKPRTKCEESWLPKDFFTGAHPFRNGRTIFFYHCMAHILKALRNALYASRKGGSRYLLNRDEIHVTGWFAIQEVYIEDSVLNIGQSRSCPGLTEDAVYITAFSSMSMAGAKAPFSEDVCSYLIGQCETEMCVECPARPLHDLEIPEGYRRTSKQGSLLKVGYYHDCVAYLNTQTWPANSKKLDLRPTVEYVVTMNELFNSVLLNSEEHLNADNIHQTITFCQSRLLYLEKWRKLQLERIKRDKKAAKHEMSFLAPCTWLNLRMAICGFLEMSLFLISEVFSDENK